MIASIPRYDFNFENATGSENTKSILVHASATTVVILLLAAFWVPIDVRGQSSYYNNADLFAHLAPRALFGTVVKIIHVRWIGFILLRQLFQTLWLFLIVFQLTRSLRSQKGSSLLE